MLGGMRYLKTLSKTGTKFKKSITFAMAGLCIPLGACHTTEKKLQAEVRTGQPQQDIQECVNDATKRNNALHGGMELVFDVFPTGQVKSAGFINNTTEDAELGNCITSKAKNWRFYSIKSGKEERFTYKFNAHGTI